MKREQPLRGSQKSKVKSQKLRSGGAGEQGNWFIQKGLSELLTPES
jgi:hypothetical protein